MTASERIRQVVADACADLATRLTTELEQLGRTHEGARDEEHDAGDRGEQRLSHGARSG